VQAGHTTLLKDPINTAKTWRLADAMPGTPLGIGRSFGDDLLVLDGDAYRDRSRPHGSTTIVRMTEAGDLSVARPDITNEAFGTDLDAYASDLSRRWQAGQRWQRA
jgi:hypothetical protein